MSSIKKTYIGIAVLVISVIIYSAYIFHCSMEEKAQARAERREAGYKHALEYWPNKFFFVRESDKEDCEHIWELDQEIGAWGDDRRYYSYYHGDGCISCLHRECKQPGCYAIEAEILRWYGR